MTEDGDEPANLNEAKEALEVLKNSRREKTLCKLGAKPSLAEYIEVYFAKSEVARKEIHNSHEGAWMPQ